jgi:hypothetical protein
MRADPGWRPLPLEVATLIAEGRVIEAIKVLRQTEGLGLKDAHDRVEAHISRDPMLRVQIDTQRRAARRKFFFWFVVIDLLITAAAIYWFVYRGST